MEAEVIAGERIYLHEDVVGDVTSNKRGSGARYNSGKPKMEFVPTGVLLDIIEHRGIEDTYDVFTAHNILEHVERFEAGSGIEHILEAIQLVDLNEICKQFAFGAQKYAPWNWAKGMKWSVPLACIKRHAVALCIQGEETDQESGVSHLGAIGCNLVMLAHFWRHYQEGDDRPPAECFGVNQNGECRKNEGS